MMVRRASWRKNPAAFRALKRRFQQVPEGAKAGTRKALRTSGNEAKRIIRGDAPKGRTLRLVRSIDWSWGDPPPGVLGAGDRRSATPVPEDMRISIYAGGKKAPHAHLVHNGTGPRVRKSDGVSTGVMPAQPFFWPNIRSLRRRQKSRITREANKAIKALVAK